MIALTRPVLCFIASAAPAAFAHAPAADAYSSRPIRIFIAVPHGSSPDILARQISHKLSEKVSVDASINAAP